MRRGLETIGAVLILAVCWVSIARLQARSVSASATVSIHIERPEEESVADPDPGLELASALPDDTLQPDVERTVVTIIVEDGRETVLHTQTPEI